MPKEPVYNVPAKSGILTSRTVELGNTAASSGMAYAEISAINTQARVAQINQQKEAAKLMLEREKQQAYFAMKQQEFEAEAQLKAMKIGAGITSNVEIRG